ncbi:2-polyprenyl-6-methoxyphenol hydroxylase [Rhodanobacter panaciterrae]|uniref:2-polyprenyl-6-methoxyphenol hydroxylase n=1 Tax=Rhodanobacter panaciterrae TaxID=490572 RepID=A0ABQ2ZVJ7_9GAMM|nr:FAD-dependent monooxygenase [Rhodanobacter panaciterrae]GGY24025.1 2-polyprenyl-6-methoxyphenol hydroxylase [Rhodanobacter panaciterrae]
MQPVSTGTHDTQVLIVGAGPTGLVLALWLTRLGIRVRIIDKAAEAGTTSRALAVQSRTLEFYRQLGIADAVVDGGVTIAGINLWVKGSKAARVPFRQIGEGLSPFPSALVFPQDAHEGLLIERLQALGVTVERQTELLRFDQDSAGVHATLRQPDGTEVSCRAAHLAGCDGARSIVREVLGFAFPGGTYTQRFYVADVDATGPVTDHELHIDLDDADFLAVFPLKGAGRIRLVGTVREPADENSALTFDDVSPRAIAQLQLGIAKVNWFSTYHVHHRVAPSFRQERAFLLGDAAHIHSPAGGQGMNTGIGDAVNLAWKLAAVLNHQAADSLLDTYEVERIRFARRLVATTDRGFTLATSEGALARQVRTRLIPLIAPLLFRLPSLRRFLFRTMSQIGIKYRYSTLSSGSTGSVHGGDRLPWVRTTTGHDNFDPLTSLAWQVHVYGETSAELTATCAEYQLPLHVFTWNADMPRAGLMLDAIYLIRPDGYIALAAADGKPQRLRDYLLTRYGDNNPASSNNPAGSR